ncbi:cyclic lactone autoinducer peptide [Alkaliphilus sp. MSJ-5]|uniref:Cyclic lactone autoinducer peptide n=1 Tax=Alkaliphilus flagellatus TaxID=2841507 RepID=A0ABS6G0I8_9FIRM|nr:cyclic lactone autoinducer peptide [Alkaliphilus flagellatus]MBU5676015.1 cyclic lactone autoinducer peptide [Alkaliphilus flagellatus]
MKRKLMGLIVTLLSFFALANVASASTVISYQPELPKSLKK